MVYMHLRAFVRDLTQEVLLHRRTSGPDQVPLCGVSPSSVV